MEDLFCTFSPNQLTDDYCDLFGVAWCVWATTWMMNWWQTVFMTRNTISFVSRLIQKCYRQNFLYLFGDVCSLNMYFLLPLFWLLYCIMPCEVRDVFIAPPGIVVVVSVAVVALVICGSVVGCCLLYCRRRSVITVRNEEPSCCGIGHSRRNESGGNESPRNESRRDDWRRYNYRRNQPGQGKHKVSKHFRWSSSFNPWSR